MNNEKIEKITMLDEHIWRTNFKDIGLQQWLDNFDNYEDRGLAIELLSQFSYFDDTMIREMLLSLYRDLFLYPIRQKILNNSELNLEEEIDKTRFLGMGNPSESGTFLLYYFRQINNIQKKLFIDSGKVEFGINSDIVRYVYIDDMSISGSQIVDYTTNDKYTITAKKIKASNPNIEINCYLLFATEEAIIKIKEKNIFNDVKAVFELDDSFDCFSTRSRYLKDKMKRETTIKMLKKYKQNYDNAPDLKGDDIVFGYNKSSLLLGLNHNTPDNTLPFFWGKSNNWQPIFMRYGKNYGK